jgi:hypothetical protein
MKTLAPKPVGRQTIWSANLSDLNEKATANQAERVSKNKLFSCI